MIKGDGIFTENTKTTGFLGYLTVNLLEKKGIGL